MRSKEILTKKEKAAIREYTNATAVKQCRYGHVHILEERVCGDYPSSWVRFAFGRAEALQYMK